MGRSDCRLQDDEGQRHQKPGFLETHAGTYCLQRQQWLDTQLGDHPGPFFIFMHHNPIPTHIGPLDEIMLKDDKAFRGIISKHAAKIRQIFFGHCHLPISGSTAGVPTTAIRGTNHAGYPRFSERHLLTNSDLPQSYGVVYIASDYVTVHMVEFGYSGPIRSGGSPDYAAWDRATMQR